MSKQYKSKQTFKRRLKRDKNDKLGKRKVEEKKKRTKNFKRRVKTKRREEKRKEEKRKLFPGKGRGK